MTFRDEAAELRSEEEVGVSLYHDLRTVRRAVGAPWFVGGPAERAYDRRPYDLNVLGIRRAWVSGAPASDLFDDAIAVGYLGPEGTPVGLAYAATTDPGRAYLLRPMRARGCAILAPGHYAGSHALGLHRGCRALVQVGVLDVYRDADRDGIPEAGSLEPAPVGTGINVHAAADDAAGPASTIVGTWSAGCQVLRRRSELAVLVDLVERQRRSLGTDAVSYTLVDEGALAGEARAAAGRILAHAAARR